jgi:hypothetical protein
MLPATSPDPLSSKTEHRLELPRGMGLRPALLSAPSNHVPVVLRRPAFRLTRASLAAPFAQRGEVLAHALI